MVKNEFFPEPSVRCLFSELDCNEESLISGGECVIKFRLISGKVKSISGCSPDQIKAVLNPQNSNKDLPGITIIRAD